MQMMAFLPIRLSPSPSPTVVVVLPSPAGVGLMAVTRISFAVLVCLRRLDKSHRQLGLIVAVRQQMLGRDPNLLANRLDRLLFCCARDLNVRLDLYHGLLSD